MPDAAAQEPPFAWPFEVRYHEVDALGVVFNMWYLGYCDAAQAAFFAHLGTSSADLNAQGLDVMLRHADVHWTGSLEAFGRAEVRVGTASVGRTSLRLRHEVVRQPDGEVVFSAEITYVCVRVAERAPVPVPDALRQALQRHAA
ncbi:acyl-CoA thioesterase [Angustibacter peucedani]